MSFRRIPFQFEATDPAERRAELLRRFGVPSDEKMFVEPKSGLYGDMALRDPKWRYMSSGLGHTGSAPCSPRLQHRVPYMSFEGDGSIPIKVLHEQRNAPNNSSSDRERSLYHNNTKDCNPEFSTPRVHVIPIEIERSISRSLNKPFNITTGHSGNSEVNCNNSASEDMEKDGEDHSRKRHVSEPLKGLQDKNDMSGTKVKVCSIPISVEGKDCVNSQPLPSTHNVPNVCEVIDPSQKDNKNSKQLPVLKGSNGSKTNCNVNTAKCEITSESAACRDSLKQISDILSEFHLLKESVERFTGCSCDKEYRYLDEMLTRCMLKLDDIDTKGNEQIRAARKSAVRDIQECINVLESKVAEDPILKRAESEENSRENEENICDKVMSSTTKGGASFKVNDKEIAELNQELCTAADIKPSEEIADTCIKAPEHLQSEKMETDEPISEIEETEGTPMNEECVEVQFASGTAIPDHMERNQDSYNEEIVA